MPRIIATAALVAALQAGQKQLITGRVVSDTGAPLENARLSVPNPGSEAPTVVLSDRDGRFTVRPSSLPTTISCAKSGYGLQQLRATGNETLECRLAAAAVISGRVVDEH